MSKVVETPSPRLRHGDRLWLLLAGLVVVVFRLHAYPAPLESDECNYAYFAQRLVAGDRLYVDLWDHQPPGIYGLLVPLTAVFGASPAVYRTVAILLVLVTLGCVFDLARRWFSRPAAWTAALLLAIASSDPGIAGEGCNREIHMNVLLAGAAWTLATCGASGRRSIFVAGLLVGLASTIKTVVVLHWLAWVPVVLMLPTWGLPHLAMARLPVFSPWRVTRSSPGERESHHGPGAILADGSGTVPPARNRCAGLYALAAFSAGPAVVWLAVAGYFALSGRAAAFFDAAFLYNLVYSEGSLSWGGRLAAFLFKGDGVRFTVFASALPLWLAGACGLVAFPWCQDRARTALMGGWLVGSYLAVCLPGKFWPHYYLLMLPPVVLLAGGLVHRLSTYQRSVGVACGVVVGLALLATEVPGYLLVDPDRIGWDRYRDRMSWVREQAARVTAATERNDSLYVWSIDAGFYYYSNRRCATRFTMFGPLTAEHPSTEQRRGLLLEDLERNRPRLILIPFGRYPPCPELRRFIQEHRYISVERTQRMEVLCPLDQPVPWVDRTWEEKSRSQKVEKSKLGR